jgi:hypothetical protein
VWPKGRDRASRNLVLDYDFADKYLDLASASWASDRMIRAGHSAGRSTGSKRERLASISKFLSATAEYPGLLEQISQIS